MTRPARRPSPQGNIEHLKALFPELITEGPNGVAVNVDVLKALVGDKTATDAEEKYGLNWHGKRRARQLSLTPSTGTLLPKPDECENGYIPNQYQEDVKKFVVLVKR